MTLNTHISNLGKIICELDDETYELISSATKENNEIVNQTYRQVANIILNGIIPNLKETYKLLEQIEEKKGIN